MWLESLRLVSNGLDRRGSLEIWAPTDTPTQEEGGPATRPNSMTTFCWCVSDWSPLPWFQQHTTSRHHRGHRTSRHLGGLPTCAGSDAAAARTAVAHVERAARQL